MFSSFNKAFKIKAELTNIPKLRQFLKGLSLQDKSFDIAPEDHNHIIISYGKEYTLPIWLIQLKRAALLTSAYALELRILEHHTLTRPGLAVMSGSSDEILPEAAFEAPMFQLAYTGNAALLELPALDLKAIDSFGLTLLHYALGHVNLVQNVARQIPELVNIPDQQGCTPCMLAAAHGQLAVLQILKAAGADMQAQDTRGNNALHMAAIAGEITTVAWLVTEGELALESRNSRKLTPYLWAAQLGQLEVLKTLKALGADTLAVDQHQNNALHLAIVGAGDVATIHWLVAETGLSVEKQEVHYQRNPSRFYLNDGPFEEAAIKAPLLLAASRGQVPILQLLKTLGVEAHVTDLRGNNALHYIAFFRMLTRDPFVLGLEIQPYMQLFELLAADFGYITTLEWLVHELQIPLDNQNLISETPFLCAIHNGCLALLDAFKKLGADLAATDHQGNSALHIAIETNNLATLEWLIQETKISLEHQRTDHKTAFLYAAQHTNLAMLKALQRSGADVTAIDDNNNNALHLAILSRLFPNFPKYYRDPITETPEFMWEIEDDRDPITETPDIELIRWLVNEAQVPLEAEGKQQMTAFLCAASRGYLNTLQFLKTLGANTQAVDANGHNALHLATLKVHRDIIPWLVEEAKLDLESRSGDQKTAFLIAAEKNDLPTLESLYHLGANPYAVDSTDRNALDILYTKTTFSGDELNPCIIWLLSEVYANDDRYSTLRLIGELKKSIDALEILFTRHQTLKTVELISNDLKPSKMARVIICLIKYHKLTHLDVSQNELGPAELKGLGIALEANKYLEDLRLYRSNITTEGLYQLLINGLAKHPNIKILDLRGNYFSNRGISVLVEGLKYNQVLEKLYLDVALTLETSEKLQALLEDGPPLPQLILNVYQNTTNFQCLNTMLGNPKIAFSSFTCCEGLTDKEICQLVSNLTWHANLRVLSISVYQLTKVEIAALIAASQAWPNLYTLELAIQGTDEVLACILELVQKLPSLRKLTLQGTCEPGCCLSPFVTNIIQMTNVRELYLQSLTLVDAIEHNAFDTILHSLSHSPYLQKLSLPNAVAITTSEQQDLQKLLSKNSDIATTIHQYTQGAKHIKSAATRREGPPAASQPLATSPRTFLISTLGDKGSQEPQAEETQEEPAAKRHKGNSP